jgi:hypothetical protein
MQKIYLLFFVVLLFNCNSSRKTHKEMRTINLFREIITGDFDNSRQVAEEIKNGKQIHPLAKHINRVIDEKITGFPIPHIMPRDKNDFWVLEESYYEYPGKAVEIKPYLFRFSQGDHQTILLNVYQFPASLKKEDIKNSNDQLKLNYLDLKPSPTFKGATYVYHEQEGTFTTNSKNDLGNGMKFTLTETLGKKQLVVMELLEKNGERLTPYDTPIVYDRK